MIREYTPKNDEEINNLLLNIICHRIDEVFYGPLENAIEKKYTCYGLYYDIMQRIDK